MTLKEQIRNAESVNWLGDGLSELEIKQTKELAKISARIEMKRRELGLSQKQFAEKIGVSQGMISKWESGEYNFTINTLNDICEKLGLIFEPIIKDAYVTENHFSVIPGALLKTEESFWENIEGLSDSEQLGVGA